MVPVGEKKASSPVLSLKGTKIIAQGKAEGRDPGNETATGSDPEGVEQIGPADVAPLQGADVDADVVPGFHPGLLSSSPSATSSYYRVIGQPEDLDGAKELAEKDKYGFQWWILPLIGARAFGAEAGKKEGKKGADKGIDGLMVFTDDNSGKAKKVVVSVKGGHNVSVAQIRDLGHVIERENAAIGVFLTLEPPTKPMLTEAAEKGFYHSPGWNKDYPRLQILTVEDLLNGKTVDLPPNLQTYKQAEKVVAENKDQGMLGFE
ncbi:MAG: restriction endonuclease [Pyrinomonadaceae bacterium]